MCPPRADTRVGPYSQWPAPVAAVGLAHGAPHLAARLHDRAARFAQRVAPVIVGITAGAADRFPDLAPDFVAHPHPLDPVETVPLVRAGRGRKGE